MFTVVCTDHQSPSKKGKYKLADIFSFELTSGINFKVPNLFSGFGILPEYEPLARPLPVYSNTRALTEFSSW